MIPKDIALKLSEISKKTDALAALIDLTGTTEDLVLESSERQGLSMILRQVSDETCDMSNEVYKIARGES